jgi:hypothetical protein
MSSIILNATGNKVEIDLLPAQYLFRLWGASGATSYCTSYGYSKGGKGGYIEGIVTLKAKTRLYAYVGTVGQACNATCHGIDYTIFNGGFNGGGPLSSRGCAGAGGGATDIRLGTDSLESRVIVAGGGGGAGVQSTGGDGGYPSGTNGSTTASTSNVISNGVGGSQEAGGTIKDCSHKCYETDPRFVINGFTATNGTFGNGGNGLGRYCGGGGGGGGWYGGGGNINAGGGGGGSSYVSPIFSSFMYENGVCEGDGKIIIIRILYINRTNSCSDFYNIIFIFLTVTLLS